MKKMSKSGVIARAGLATAFSLGLASQAHSQVVPVEPLTALREQVSRLEERLESQERRTAEQETLVALQRQEIERLSSRLQFDDGLAQLRGLGLGAADAATFAPGVFRERIARASTATGVQEGADSQPPAGSQEPAGPVGEAPPEPVRNVEIEAIPEGQGVLTPRGQYVLDPSFEYTRSSTNRLVFRGIELIPGIQIGLIEATDADRDTLALSSAFRYGVTNRLEIEARLPVLSRSDRIEVAQQRDEGIVRAISLREEYIGDFEFGARYQLNRPAARGQRPIYVANLRVKSDTGKSPFEVGYDEFGVATGLSTGSGFWAVQPGVSMLLPSDPAVIFGGLSYLYHIPRDIDRNIGGAFIGRVDPGDAISGNIGFGFALNPRFSYSLGYRHSYIYPTETEIGGTLQESRYLQVGTFNFGLSYRLSEQETLNVGFEIGVTEDAPDVSITFRMPFSGSALPASRQR